MKDNVKKLVKEKFPELSQVDLDYLEHMCDQTQLDPIARQIYIIKRDGKQMVQVSIDGARLVAVRTGEYEGQVGPYWCGEDGVWKDVWLSKENPTAAKIGVFRRGFREPAWGVCRYDAYVGKKLDGKPNMMWSKMADVMLAKCSEMVALRKSFPAELSGVYSEDEMDQASHKQEHAPIAPSMDLEGNGNTEPTHYKIPFGKYVQKTLEQVGPDELRDYVNYIEGKAKKDGKALTGNIADFIKRAEDFIGAHESEYTLPPPGFPNLK